MLFGNHFNGLMDVIRCDESSYLVWKWHPEGSAQGQNKRENSIRFGSTLRVKNGEVAVLVYNQNNLYYEDYIEGPFDAKLRTANLPVLASLIGLAYGGDSPFQAEIYFINLAKIIQVRFAIPYFDVFEPAHPDFGVPVAARGSLNFHIADYMNFVKKHRLVDFNLDNFQSQIRSLIVKNAKQIIANLPAEKEITILQMEREIANVSNELSDQLTPIFRSEYGVDVTEVNVDTIEIDKTSDEYHEYINVTRKLSAEKAIAQNEAEIKNIHDMQRINAENIEETNRINREETQYAEHKQTQSANFDAYKVEAQEHVGVAGAEGLGKMGANGSTNAGGINVAEIMAGMTIGSAVGQNIVKNMNDINKETTQNKNVAPPPVPSDTYYVANNGKADGPYTVEQLTVLKDAGKFSSDSYVWQKGMKDWKHAETIDRLKFMFASDDLPPIPKE